MESASQDMKSMLEEFPEAQLQIKDRLPYNFLIAQMILTFQKAILNIQYSAEELREATEGFVNMIPKPWKDDEFFQDLREAQILIPVDTRPVFCEVPASDRYCQRHQIETQRYVKSFDYMKVFNAVVNLLDRRHMLLKSTFKETLFDEEQTADNSDHDASSVEPSSNLTEE